MLVSWILFAFWLNWCNMITCLNQKKRSKITVSLRSENLHFAISVQIRWTHEFHYLTILKKGDDAFLDRNPFKFFNSKDNCINAIWQIQLKIQNYTMSSINGNSTSIFYTPSFQGQIWTFDPNLSLDAQNFSCHLVLIVIDRWKLMPLFFMSILSTKDHNKMSHSDWKTQIKFLP